ncbi:MAG: hypothetical protein OHK0046_14300 [Anaerolineae bacterium]
MADRFVESHIRRLPIFARVPPDQLTPIIEAFQVMRYEPGEFLFRQGEPTQGMIVFVSGQAQLIQTHPATGRSQVIGLIQANQYLNELALFQAGTETASLYAIETSTVLFLSRARLMNIIGYYPELRQYLPVAQEAVPRRAPTVKVFAGQRDSEGILLNSRRHWWAYVRKSWPAFFLAIAIIIGSGYLPSPALSLVIVLLALVIAGVYVLYNYLEWRNDRVIITDQRVIRIERDILSFKTSISEVPLTSIQEVNADNITADPFSRLFNYGMVEIKTAGDAGNMKLTVIPDPDNVQDIIFDNRNRQRENREREHLNTIRATIDKAIGNDQSSSQPTIPTTPPPAKQNRSLLPTRFIGDKGEIVYRRHLVFWAARAFVPVIGLVASVMLMLLGGVLPILQEGGIIVSIFGFFMALIFGIWLYFADWDWRNDLYIISDDTVQLVHRRPFWLQNEIDQVLLASVDNVVSEQSGLLQSLFGYGNVKISLIGSDPNDAKVFKGAPKPRQIASEISGRQARVKQRAREADERRRREEIAEYLSVYHQTVSANQAPGYGGQPGVPGSTAAATDGEQGRPVRDRVRPPKVPRLRK